MTKSPRLWAATHCASFWRACSDHRSPHAARSVCRAGVFRAATKGSGSTIPSRPVKKNRQALGGACPPAGSAASARNLTRRGPTSHMTHPGAPTFRAPAPNACKTSSCAANRPAPTGYVPSIAFEHAQVFGGRLRVTVKGFLSFAAGRSRKIKAQPIRRESEETVQ